MEKTKEKGKSNLIYVMIALFLAVYIPSIYNLICGKTINVGFISIGDIEESINTRAYIIRDEILINAPFTGKYVSDVREGEKVQANQVIAQVLREGDEEILRDIKKLDFEILEAKRSKASGKEVYNSDILKIDKKIEENIEFLIRETNDAGNTNYKRIKDEIDSLMMKKSEIIGQNAANDSYIDTKINERKLLRDRLDKEDRNIRVQNAGMISFCVDGFENILNMASVQNLEYDFFDKEDIKNVRRDADNIMAKASTPFAKLIKGIDAYVVVVLDEKSATKYQEGAQVRVRFNDVNKLVPGKVVKKNSSQGKTVVAVKVSSALQYLSSYRVCNVDLISNAHSGLKVPKKSLKDYDKESRIAKIGVIKSNKVEYKYVKVLGYNNEFAIIENNPLKWDQSVNLYDEFIIEPENVVEGQIINKV
ncbi:MAG: hypothetical protein J6Y29_05740 [Clostridiales bacterium]|nr:hypothetical protein [Clostridiales bacterium]